jgi:putative acetyltransferase
MMSIKLRDIRDGEQHGVFAIVKDVLRRYGLKVNPEVTDKDLSDIRASYLDGGGCFKVAEAEGEIVGSYGLFPLSSTACELRKMYLLPEFQGKGVGRLMMDDALAEARDRNFKEMVLETNSVLDKAARLYRSYGFEEYAADHLSDRCDCAMKLSL